MPCIAQVNTHRHTIVNAMHSMSEYTPTYHRYAVHLQQADGAVVFGANVGFEFDFDEAGKLLRLLDVKRLDITSIGCVERFQQRPTLHVACQTITHMLHARQSLEYMRCIRKSSECTWKHHYYHTSIYPYATTKLTCRQNYWATGLPKGRKYS